MDLTVAPQSSVTLFSEHWWEQAMFERCAGRSLVVNAKEIHIALVTRTALQCSGLTAATQRQLKLHRLRTPLC